MPFNKPKALQEAERLAAQGKLPQAIRQYLEIAENDPQDLNLLNTIGDLCVRDNKIDDAMVLFRKLADAYVREGFTLKAIAIFKKISKLEPDSVDPPVKLAELYMAQGLTREALALFGQALELCQKKGMGDRALEIMRQVVAADAANVTHRVRLAEASEALGRKEAAARAYLEAAELLLGRGDSSAAQEFVSRAARLDPAQPQVRALRRRLSPEAEAEEEPAVEVPPEAASAEPAPAEAAPALGEETVAADSTPSGESPAAGAPSGEVDLSGELEALTLSAQPAPEVESADTFDRRDAEAELDFYLSTGLIEQAQSVLRGLEERFPDDEEVAALRRTFEEKTAGLGGVGLPPVPAAAPGDPLASLSAELEASWTGFENRSVATAAPSPDGAAEFSHSLAALVDELGEESHSAAESADPETHYALGVAFREMNLLDEAIGEFQKSAKVGRGGSPPPHFLSTCTLLGLCFMEKQLPALAAKWYGRALELPDLDDDSRLALLYDLGLAQEQAGDQQAAAQKFLEVYSLNIDYRDVADKVRQLQQKGSR